MRLVTLLVVLTCFSTVVHESHAQSAAVTFTPKIKPELRIQPTTGRIRVDGELDEEGWLNAARVTDFTAFQPIEMAEPSVKTEVFVTYDHNYLYLGFRAYDDPATIRASLSNRDEMFQDDWVGIILDTYGDAVQGFEIFANPLGVQADLLWTPGREDVGFDLIFDSAGKLTDDGYQVEFAIPFSSLRFPRKEEHVWRISFLRNHPRESRYLYSWAAVTENNPCILCQLGTIQGITHIAPATRAEIIPAVVGSQTAALVDTDNPSSDFDYARINPEASLNLRYNISSSLAAEATINPDFSQVESDAAQIDVNTTFALFYPERRPFFQEGSDLFNTFLNVIYTRSLNDPIGAVKTSGRIGPTSIAFISALDEHTPLLLPFEERSELVEGGRSLSNIFRARRTFGGSTYLGGTITDRRLFDGGSGSLVSADFRTQIWKSYVIETQAALSHSVEPEISDLPEGLEFFGDGYTAILDGESFTGSGLHFSFERQSRHWSFDLSYESASPTFRAANGFITRNAYRAVNMRHEYSFYPKTGFADLIEPQMSVRRSYNFEGERKRESFNPSIIGMLKGQTFAQLSYEFARERYREVDFEGLRSWRAGFNTDFRQWLGGAIFVNGGREIARFLDDPEVGRQFGIFAGLRFRPTQRLAVNPSFEFASLHDLETDEEFFSGYIIRTLTSFQFTRELSTRLVVQYNDFSGQLDVEPLVSYRLNPFSIFYVGSTHDFVDFDGPYGLTETGRQIFFKFQYLIRR